MRRKLLFNNFNSCRKTVLIFCLTIFTSYCVLAQSRQISGSVNAGAESVPGATIRIKGTSNGTTTDVNGNFKLSVSDNTTLVISFLGYETQEINVGNKTSININLSSSNSNLNEVVVIGYGTSKRKDLVSAVNVVAAKDAGSTTSVNAAQLLVGKAPGVQVVENSGVPGVGAQIIIRGTGSFTSVDPLYVIDGIQGDANLFGMISPQDIDNITILKDAASTAIYGVAGANGVVIVTTKKGKAGTTQISFSTQAGISSVPKKLSLMNSAEYVDLIKDIDATNNNPVPPKFSTPAVLIDQTNWQNQIFKTALSTQNNLSISGGSDKVTYNMSLGYVTQDAIVNSYQFNRLNNRFSLDEHLGRFHFGETLNLRYTTTDGQIASIPNALTYAPYQPVYDPTVPGGYSIVTNTADNSNVNNPLQPLGVQSENSHDMTLYPEVFGELKIINGLTFRSQLSAVYGSTVTDSYQIPYTASNDLSYIRQAGRSFSSYSDYRVENYFSFNHDYGKSNISATLGASYVNAGSSKFTSLLGTGMLTDALKDISAAPTIAVQSTTSGYYNVFGQERSYYGRLIYTYDDKYIFSASIRRDGAANFGALSQYGDFPGLGFAWRFIQEDFIKSAFPFLSDGKFRIGYGRTGNNSFGLNSTQVYAFGGASPGGLVYSFGQNENFVSGETVTTISNPLLHWEQTAQTDAGIDLGFLNNRLTFNADYYNRNSSGLLVSIPIPTSVGIGINTTGSVEEVNAASVRNRGIEFQVGFRNTISPDFGYNVSVNGAYNQNKTISLGTQSPTPIVSGYFDQLNGIELTQPGMPIGAFYGYKVDHVAKNQAEIDALNKIAQQKTGNPNAVYQAGLLPGDFIFKDLNGDGTVDAKDQTVLGSAIPKFVYGINLGANYKNFDLNVVLAGEQGVQIANSLNFFLDNASTGHNASTALLNRWEKPGDVAEFPRAGQDETASGNLRPSDFFIENGAYLKMRNITLGYTLSNASLRSFSGNVLSKLRIYVAAENLFTITGYKGYDPEISTQSTNTNTTGGDYIFSRGIDDGQVPNPRTFLVGIQAGF